MAKLLEVRRFDSGDTIVQQGDPADVRVPAAHVSNNNRYGPLFGVDRARLNLVCLCYRVFILSMPELLTC
jgi:hypothetical protein